MPEKRKADDSDSGIPLDEPGTVSELSEKRRKHDVGTTAGPSFFRPGSGSGTSSAFTPVETTAHLITLLDLSALTSQPAIQNRFDILGRALLQDFVLVVRVATEEVVYRILELEFYLQIDGGVHQDPFTHGSEEQSVSGNWYFHRAPRWSNDATRSATSLTSYRGGTRKGLDLTFGAPIDMDALGLGSVMEEGEEVKSRGTSKYFGGAVPTTMPATESADVKGTDTNTHTPKIRGGILLRTIRRLSASKTSSFKRSTATTTKTVSGPSLLVDELLLANGIHSGSIPDLVKLWGGEDGGWRGAFRPDRAEGMFLRPRGGLKQEERIYTSPRVGLDLSHQGITLPSLSPTTRKLGEGREHLHPRITFLPLPYRYFTHPAEVGKNNSKLYTFLGVLRSLLLPSTPSTSPLSSPTPWQPTPAQKRTLVSRVAALAGLKEGTAGRYVDEYLEGREQGTKGLKRWVGVKARDGGGGGAGGVLRMLGCVEGVLAGTGVEG